MKLIKRNISAKNGSGMVLLRPESTEDMWHAYNLLQVGDLVRTTTLRKVTRESNTGSTSSQKVRLSLTIEIERVDFDEEAVAVRLSGPNREESDHVKLGAYHTLTLEQNKNFSLEKQIWDQILLDRIEEATNPERGSEMAAVVMAATGLAHVCLMTGPLTITKARIDTNIPKKRTGSSQQSKATTKFYEAIYQALLRHVDFAVIKVVLLASPGFVKDDFFKYLLEESHRRNDRAFIENKGKFVLTNASSGHKHALEEVLSDSSVVGKLTQVKVVREVEVLNRFMRMIDTHPDKAYYGYAHVKRADDELAVDHLLVTDGLFRSATIQVRKRYVELVESVREHGGTVHILSSMHLSGQQLAQVSGVAAILRYPLPDLEELEELAAAAAATHEEEEQQQQEQEYDPERRIREDLKDMGF